MTPSSKAIITLIVLFILSGSFIGLKSLLLTVILPILGIIKLHSILETYFSKK